MEKKFIKKLEGLGGSTKRREMFPRDQDAGFDWGWSL